MQCRLYPDPEDQCVACQGRGARKMWDADCGDEWLSCIACAGIATAGVYVVRLHIGEISYEQRYHSFSYELACARAERWAGLVRYFSRRFAVAGAEVRVLWKPVEQHEEEEDVYAVAVWTPTPTKAA